MHIIPYQEPPGNYNFKNGFVDRAVIIPYQEPPGNYNGSRKFLRMLSIIPYQEPSGNYNFNCRVQITKYKCI